MSNHRFTECVVEEVPLAWAQALGYALLHGQGVATGKLDAERDDLNYCDVIPEQRLRQALARVDPDIWSNTIEDAFQKLTRADAPSIRLHRCDATVGNLDSVPCFYRQRRI